MKHMCVLGITQLTVLHNIMSSVRPATRSRSSGRCTPAPGTTPNGLGSGSGVGAGAGGPCNINVNFGFDHDETNAQCHDSRPNIEVFEYKNIGGRRGVSGNAPMYPKDMDDNNGTGIGMSDSTEYIIRQNERLLEENSVLRKQYHEIEASLYEAGDDIDSLDKTRTCLRGYVKNESEKARMSREMLMTSIDASNDILVMVYTMISVIIVTNVASLVSDVSFHVFNGVYSASIVQVAVVISLFRKIYKTNVNVLDEFEKYNSVYNKTTESSDYLCDLVDNM